MVMCLYTISHELLSCINVPSYLLNGDGADMFNKCDILNTVNQIYTDIVCAFFEASCVAIPRKNYNFTSIGGMRNWCC